MDVPMPWTSSGVGTAIPGSELGGPQPTASPPTTATGPGQEVAGKNGKDKATKTVTVVPATETTTNGAGRLGPVHEAVVGSVVGCWVGLAVMAAAVGGLQLVH